jgi:hypothetical protein
MRSRLTIALPVLFVLASSCWRRTELINTWHEPNASVLNFRKSVAVFVSTDEGMRRSVEDQLSMKFPNTMPAYRVIPNAGAENQNTILEKMRGAGFDGAIVMRVLDVQERLTWNPGSYWGPNYGFGGYWGSSWAYPYNPGYITVNQIVTVETQIYSLAQDKLVFAARSETTDPKNVGKLIRSVMRHIDEELRKSRMMASRYARPGEIVTEVAAH